jgi:hypothetical protein
LAEKEGNVEFKGRFQGVEQCLRLALYRPEPVFTTPHIILEV